MKVVDFVNGLLGSMTTFLIYWVMSTKSEFTQGVALLVT
jgi:hypothetical protein